MRNYEKINLPDFMDISFIDSSLEPIVAKVANGERLSFEDGMILEVSEDIHSICRLADLVRERMHGNRIGYISNVHIDYTNICVSKCKFCAYWRDAESDSAYTLTSDEAIERVPNDVQEIHLVGGLNPTLPLSYFLDILKGLKERFPEAVIKAFTAVEIYELTRRSGLGPWSVLDRLHDAGLGMLPGGGAEIFDEGIRNIVCPYKASADDWLFIHRSAHEMGIPSNSTMLHGHIEKPEHRIDHLIRLRGVQDDTGGFVAHIPLPYLPGNNSLSGTHAVDGTLDIREIAIARLMLDNIPHIKAYWRALGIRMAQAGLRAGADDLDGTVNREDIMHEAGSGEPRGLTLVQLRKIIKGAGLEPYRRNAFHESMEEAAV
ncbi:MAG: CofH family radical SAM protein [bacterium]|nr:CofH family radical SAM protein [bacterium]